MELDIDIEKNREWQKATGCFEIQLHVLMEVTFQN